MRQGANVRLRRDGIALAVVTVGYLAVSTFVTNSYYQLILTLVPIWAVFGVSWNILSGYGGQLSFGHASFFGIGAYTVTLALMYLEPHAVAGHTTRHGGRRDRRGDHRHADIPSARPLLRAVDARLSAGNSLHPAVPRFPGNVAADASGKPALHIWNFPISGSTPSSPSGLLAAGVLVCMLVENSRFGLALLAIRQNELAAEAAGINARQWKMRALVTSGTIAAAAGGLYACVLLVVTPDSVFGLLVSAQPVVVTLFGGVASIWGPVIGAAILVPLAESLNAQLGNIIPGIQGVVYGARDHRHHPGRAGRACTGRSATAGSVAPCRRRPLPCPPHRCLPAAMPPQAQRCRCCRWRACRVRSVDCAR